MARHAPGARTALVASRHTPGSRTTLIGVLALVSACCSLPLSPAGARLGVISRLFPQLTPSLPQLIPTRTFTQRKQAALRWRVAQTRASVERATREIAALEALSTSSRTGEEARQARIVELRQEAGVAESRILLLKAKSRQAGLPRRYGWVGAAERLVEVFLATEERSARVLLSQLSKQADPWDLVREDTFSLLRLGSNASLVAGYASLRNAERLAPHAAAIAARAAKLERYAPGILVAVDGHLAEVEPHLDEILERLDEIEPHLPFVLRHLDLLAPHCGALLKHIDALLLYADDGGKYLDPLLPYVPRFVPLLDSLGPHLALLRPHMSKVLPHMPVIAPTAHRFARQLDVSANADILIFYFGWVLRVPWLGRSVLRLPFMPRLASFLAKRLPRRLARGRTCDYICDWSDCDVTAYTSEMAALNARDGCGRSFDGKRQRIRATSAVIRRMREA